MSLSTENECATTTPVADLRDVHVVFTTPTGDERHVLNGVDLQVRPGEFLVLVGKSGCGKTTILNMLAGLVEPTAGEVDMLGGQPRDARERMSYMFARDALIPWRTARKNVEFPLELRGKPRHERREKSARYLEMVHMSHASSQWPWQLSQGMRQRVALARTWASEPDILLMDEPFAALDAQTRLAVQQELVGMWKATGKAVIFVTHDLNEALMLGQRVVLVKDGQVAIEVNVPFEYPRSAELTTHPDFQSLRRELMCHFL
ncbi:ABC transporter ATP-binding protein [Prescottella sp. R16]|uniref:ABC transporter ATP-binding protein n=1 Tax=Prescottella sp. R16 TaxID=3064529 RepID=UPI00272E8DAD|nr:ABC transporter ATP-binding protein [Prescottella sp. R16]